ncbi:hypothetical protein [Klebsiella aerogenes]|uniref:hypothetical protein n=1 Tax=Klebsiella aerogenes TaxID=548 RepID=UPI003D31838E
MNTSYHEGLQILVNSGNNDLICSSIKTSLSGHLVSVFSSTDRYHNSSQISARVVSKNGILNTSFIVPDMTTGIQKDADIAPIDGTDKFIAVWASSAASSNYRIYMRSFTLDNKGKLINETVGIQVSQSNGDYVAPRVIYNKAHKIVLVMWASVADKEIQFKAYKIDANGGFTEASYQQSLDDTFTSEYFTSSLDLSNNTTLSLSFLNVGEKALAVIKKDRDTLGFYTLSPAGGGKIDQTHLIDYAVTNIATFSVAYDSAAPAFKIVYVRTGQSDVYGDTISYFPTVRHAQVFANEITLNQSNHNCERPFIQRTPAIDTSGERYFVVAWETYAAGAFYNEFTSDFAQVSTEQEINQGDTTTDNPRIVVTDNQTVVIVNASKFRNESMSGTGILYNVETHQSA